MKIYFQRAKSARLILVAYNKKEIIKLQLLQRGNTYSSTIILKSNIIAIYQGKRYFEMIRIGINDIKSLKSRSVKRVRFTGKGYQQLLHVCWYDYVIRSFGQRL